MSVQNLPLEAKLDLVERNKSLNELVYDENWKVRYAIAKKGHCLNLLVHDENVDIRAEVAAQGYGLSILVEDPEWVVRKAVAEQGYSLEKLINDPSADVRLAVAKQSYGLEILKDDPDPYISRFASQMFIKAFNSMPDNAPILTPESENASEPVMEEPEITEPIPEESIPEQEETPAVEEITSEPIENAEPTETVAAEAIEHVMDKAEIEIPLEPLNEALAEKEVPAENVEVSHVTVEEPKDEPMAKPVVEEPEPEAEEVAEQIKESPEQEQLPDVETESLNTLRNIDPAITQFILEQFLDIKNFYNGLNENIDNLNDNIDSVLKQQADSLSIYIKMFKQVQNERKKDSESLKASSSQLNKGCESLKEASEQLNKDLARFLESNPETAEPVEKPMTTYAKICEVVLWLTLLASIGNFGTMIYWLFLR